MKTIKTIEGDEIICDDEDFDFLSKFTYHTVVKGNYKFPQIAINTIQKLLLGQQEKGKFVDHINGNSFDNRRSNYRISTIQESNCNRGKHKRISPKWNGTSSKYKGVVAVYHKGKKGKISKYVKATIHSKNTCLTKSFRNEYDAAVWYNNMALKLHGEYARLNNIKVEQLDLWKDK